MTEKRVVERHRHPNKRDSSENIEQKIVHRKYKFDIVLCQEINLSAGRLGKTALMDMLAELLARSVHRFAMSRESFGGLEAGDVNRDSLVVNRFRKGYED